MFINTVCRRTKSISNGQIRPVISSSFIGFRGGDELFFSLKRAIIENRRTICNSYTVFQSNNSLQEPSFKKRHRDSLRAKPRSLKVELTPLDKARFKMEWPKITLFGDSITRRSKDPDNGCWGSMIAYHFGEYFQTDVFGFEGYNTKWALELMPKLFPKTYLEKVEIFIPFFGHNDSWTGQMALNVPVDQYEANYRKMLKYLNENGLENRKIVLITPSWYHHEDANKSFASSMEVFGSEIGKKLEDAEKYSEVILKLANEFQIDVIDFFRTSCDFKPLETMFCDGIHFSRLGARMLYDKLEPVLERKIERSYGKPIGELYHVLPLFQVPDMVKAIQGLREEQQQKLKELEESMKKKK